MASEFFAVTDRRALIDAINRRARATDVYIGCAPRSRRSGTKDAVTEVWTLWAECDGASAAKAARRFMPRPAMVVGSGSGPNVHAYWPLRDVPSRRRKRSAPTFASPPRWARTDVLRRGAHPPPARHVEPQVTAAAASRACSTIASPCASMSTRSSGGAPARRCRAGRAQMARAASRRQHDDPLLRIAPPVYVQRLLGISARRERKVRCPFHDDERPSLHVYRTAERGWHCFSCRRGGSIYDLAAEVWGMGTRGRAFIELRRRLGEEFNVEVTRARRRAEERALSR